MTFENPDCVDHALNRLRDELTSRSGTLSIALSGGIDSITLMTVAHRVRDEPTIAVHAVSPAVPTQATRRCERLAKRFGWQLRQLDAGEFASKQYRENPTNRCYFCKSSLFGSVLRELSQSTDSLATGTNTDDLNDYRPGLQAASEHGVWQPYVDAKIDKTMIRKIASLEGLGVLAKLPAQPCLSSRIETGIAIDPVDLHFVNWVERLLGRLTGQDENRCRITAAGVVIQLPAQYLEKSTDLSHERLLGQMKTVCARHQRDFVRIEPYQKGSAFLHKPDELELAAGVPVRINSIIRPLS